MPVAPPLGTLCTPAPACGPRPLTIVSMWTLAVNFSGQTERPWEVTIRLSYNFLPLKPMLKLSSKRVGTLSKSGMFNTNETTVGCGCWGWGWTGTVVLSGKFGGKGEKLTFENLGDFLKSWDDEGSRLSRVGMNGEQSFCLGNLQGKG